MAEVPEVKTLVRDLRDTVVGRAFHNTIVLQPESVRFTAAFDAGVLAHLLG